MVSHGERLTALDASLQHASDLVLADLRPSIWICTCFSVWRIGVRGAQRAGSRACVRRLLCYRRFSTIHDRSEWKERLPADSARCGDADTPGATGCLDDEHVRHAGVASPSLIRGRRRTCSKA